MLKIDNIATSKDLDQSEMNAIVGGSTFLNLGGNANSMGGLSFGGAQINEANVTQVDASQHQYLDQKSVSNSINAIGSIVAGVQQK
jgi:hypothetical protein